ncbi:hypothetical protein F5Y09DRAFT_328318 [Xylaria sp. FL1042]|nr:hypothetical protein F5Y09DRAFT_328318 [Xylaria sp. FL1042]
MLRHMVDWWCLSGVASGISYGLSNMYYQRGGHVYIAGCSSSRAQHGFKSKETKVHVLWNNAGVSRPAVGSMSKQVIELQVAANCLGPFLFTQLLLSLIKSIAVSENSDLHCDFGSVRVGGLIMSELQSPPADATRLYVNSKIGNMFLASELARRYDIASVSTNLGAASTNLFKYLAWPLLHFPAMAALTQLFAGIYQDMDATDLKGGYIIPWGRVSRHLRDDLLHAVKQLE